MAAEIVELQSELRSIHQLIEDLLQRRTAISNRIATLESDNSTSVAVPSTSSAKSWSSAVKGKPTITSLPLFEPYSTGNDDIPLSNFFSPLVALSPEDSFPSLRKSARVRKRSSPIAASSPPGASPAPQTPSAPPGHKRRRMASVQPKNQPMASPVESPAAARPLSPVCSAVASRQLRGPGGAPALTSGGPITRRGSGGAPALPSGGPTRSELAPRCGDDQPGSEAQLGLLSADANAAKGTVWLSPKLAIYNSNATKNPEILIVGDSLIRHLTLPGAITYCLSGAKVLDVINLIPAIVDEHPSAHTVLVHVGSNDVMDRKSTQLQSNLESLCCTVEALGKRCIMSGPIPALLNHSERFSRLLSLHHWLKNFCIAAGYDFISNFDYFWHENSLYKKDGLHLNRKGTKILTKNFIQYIAFSL